MYTYTATQLEHKTFGELKSIARELNVLPSADRRCRQNWINAIVGVNPPLLQLLETSPAEVEPVQEAIEPAAETSPGVEPATELIHSRPTKKAQEYKFLLCLKEGDNTLWYDGKDFVCEKWSAKTYCERGVGSAKHQLRFHPEVRRVVDTPWPEGAGILGSSSRTYLCLATISE